MIFRASAHRIRTLPEILAVVLLVALGAAPLTACATPPRAPAWTCMQQTVDSLPLSALPDSRKHCVAAGAIAQRCGTWSSMAAGYGKELADLVGPGAMQAQDLEANRAGRECAGQVDQEAELQACCEAAGY